MKKNISNGQIVANKCCLFICSKKCNVVYVTIRNRNKNGFVILIKIWKSCETSLERT